MKIIDLLNKIEKGEKVPKHIKYLNLIWEYDDEIKDYINDDTYLIYSLNAFGLNDKIEIIEESKRIEPFTKEEMEIYHDMSAPIDDLAHKVSLIIDYINSKEANNE